MIKQICLNIPVADLPKSKAFFKALGIAENPQVASNDGAMIVISESIAVMLTTHPELVVSAVRTVTDLARRNTP